MLPDVRIGNWVKPSFEDIHVKIIGKEGDDYLLDKTLKMRTTNANDIIEDKGIDRLTAVNLEGISITEDILKYFGFLKQENEDPIYWYYAKKVIPHGFKSLFYVTEKISQYKMGGIYKMENLKLERACDDIRFFHQLQNCFYMESGIELF